MQTFYSEMKNQICKNCGQRSEFSLLPTSLGVSSAQDSVFRCHGCGGWSVEIQSQVNFEKLYSQDHFNGSEYLNYEASNKAQQKNFKRKLNLLRDNSIFQPAMDSVVEIGCASGGFLEHLRSQGVSQLLGLEISDYARNLASKKIFLC